MRVIAGTAKGRRLRGPETTCTRPITDRAKESLFNIITPRISGNGFLDLFAGTGSVGIEALSRGCAHATFVECSETAVADIRHNLEITRLSDRAKVIVMDVFQFLSGSPRQYGIIFVAPPQWQGLWSRTVESLDQAPHWLASNALIIAQHDPSESQSLKLHNLQMIDQRSYARVCLTFFGRTQSEE